MLDLKWEEIGEHYGRYRLHVPESGTRHGAVARALWAVVAGCRVPELGPVGAVRGLAQIPRLSVRLMEADEGTAKTAMYGLNRAGSRTRELESAWIIQALVREDGLSQVEVAQLLGRHKTWVCRRLPLIERLRPKATDELRVGLLTPTAARQIVRLPQDNQTEVLEAIRRKALSSAELGGVVDLWLRRSERRQQEYLLPHAREALSQSKGVLPAVRDPRLSEAGNRVWKRVGMLLDVLRHMGVASAPRAHGTDTAGSRNLVAPLQRLARDAGSVAALTGISSASWTRMKESTRNEIISLHYGGASQRRIAKLLGVARKSVARVLVGDERDRAEPMEVERPRRPSVLIAPLAKSEENLPLITRDMSLSRPFDLRLFAARCRQLNPPRN